MRTAQTVAPLLLAVLMAGTLVGPSASAQTVRVEAGGGWAIPASEITMRVQGEQNLGAALNPGSGPNAYAAVGLVWGVSDAFSLETRLRTQQSRMRVDAGDFDGVERCLDCPGGRLWGISLEGQITLTSVGRINPYFLVGLGVVRTTIDGVRIATSSGAEFQLSEVDVTDAGGDVGFGATTRIAGGLYLTAETRVTGSLPGAKENAVTTFPFTLGLSYEFR
jgi:opacity protein-like surface antigen